MDTRHLHCEITIRRPGMAPYPLPLDIVTYPAKYPEAGRDVLADIAPSSILPGDWATHNVSTTECGHCGKIWPGLYPFAPKHDCMRFRALRDL